MQFRDSQGFTIHLYWVIYKWYSNYLLYFYRHSIRETITKKKKKRSFMQLHNQPNVRVSISVQPRGRLLAHETFNVPGSFDRSSGCGGLVGSTRSPGRTRVPWRHRRCSYLLVEFFLRPSYSSQLCKFHLSEVAR